MALKRIVFEPGINRESSEYATGAGWYDCDKIRFRKGRPEQIGGWEKYAEASFKGVARSLFDWGTAAAAKWLGVGTSLKFYVETGGTYSDITPIRLTTAAGDVTVSAVNGDETLTITENGHGAADGDYVTFSGLVTLGGLITAAVLNQEYRIAAITDANIYTLEAKDVAGDPVTANASDTGNGGAAGVAEYQINTGTNTYLPSTGYGVGPYGDGPYGGAGTLSFSGQLRIYSQDKFGDDLIFNPRAGGVYFWDESVGSGTRAVALSSLGGASDAPTKALQVMVSPIDRHVICFGVNPIGSADIDPLLVRWSDQENVVDWTPTAINTSGGKVLESGTLIIGAVRTRHEKLIFTDTSIHSMRFSGAPFVYQITVVSEGISTLAPKAAVSVGDAVFFMGTGGFYVYRGSVQPLNCTVLDYVFSALDKGQAFKTFAVNNPDNNEVTWFYPTGDSQSEINSYVTYNYMEKLWMIGTFARGAWIHAETRDNPISSSNDTVDVETQYLYNQEIGLTAEGGDILPTLESGRFGIEDGDLLVFMDRFISDFRYSGNTDSVNLSITIKGAKWPTLALSTLATKTVLATTQQSNVRCRAREFVLQIEGMGNGYGWNMGNFRFDVRTDGQR